MRHDLRRGARALGLGALGAAAALGQAPWGLWWLALPAFALAFASAPARFWAGWVLGLGYFGLAMQWIVAPFLVEADRHGWMAPFALLLMAGGLALFWGTAFALAGRFRLGRLGLAVLWAGAEAARSFLFSGLPWALVGHIWIDTGLSQLAAATGPQGLTLLTLAAAAALGTVLAAVSGGQGLRGWRWFALWPLALAPLGWWLHPGPPPATDPAQPLIRIVQPNVPQAEKWDPALVEGHLRRMLDLTRGAADGEEPARPDFVIWPETAVPQLLEWAEPVLAAASDAAQGAPLALGIARRVDSRYFNSLVFLGPSGAVFAQHDKAHLTPFGEFIPFGEIFARFGIHGLAASEGGGFSPGPGLAQVTVPGVGPVLPLICYEGIFAEEVNGPARGARALVLATNDAWFGTRAGPQQHLVQARFRAIEQGMPLLRAANTGISAVIDAQGRVLARLELGETGALDARLPPARPPTLYARWRDWIALVAGLALLTVALVLHKRPH